MDASTILNRYNWDGDFLRREFSDSDLKHLEEEASRIHTLVEGVNEFMLKGKFILHTNLVGWEKESKYVLKVKIKYYDTEKKHKYKENTHRQKINI